MFDTRDIDIIKSISWAERAGERAYLVHVATPRCLTSSVATDGLASSCTKVRPLTKCIRTINTGRPTRVGAIVTTPTWLRTDQILFAVTRLQILVANTYIETL